MVQIQYSDKKYIPADKLDNISYATRMFVLDEDRVMDVCLVDTKEAADNNIVVYDTEEKSSEKIFAHLCEQLESKVWIPGLEYSKLF
jgi:hypothetical protein